MGVWKSLTVCILWNSCMYLKLQFSQKINKLTFILSEYTHTHAHTSDRYVAENFGSPDAFLATDWTNSHMGQKTVLRPKQTNKQKGVRTVNNAWNSRTWQYYKKKGRGK